MITIIESPNNWQNLYNEIVVAVSGSNSTQPNFQFLCDVNVSGQSNPVTRLTYPKQPLVGTVQINVADVVKNYVTYDFSSFNTLDLVKCVNSEVKYWLEFGEIYDNVSGVPTIYANQAQYGTSGSPKSGSNAIFDFLDWSKTAFSTSKLLGTSNQVSLNDNSYREKIRNNQQRFLTFFSTNSSNIVIVDLVLYNSQGDATFSSSYSTYTPLTGIVSLNIGDTMLDFFGASGFMSSSAYYRVDIRNSGDEIVFTKTIDIDNSCTQFTNYRLHWLNSMGGFDAFNFNMVSTERIEIDTKEFKKVQQLGYAKTDRLKTKYFTKFMESVTLNSDLLSDAEYAALEQLVLSPVVMLETSPSTYIPVNVVANNYVKKKYEQGRTIPNMELTIQYSFDNYRQSL
jgi:hypothetical protein